MKAADDGRQWREHLALRNAGRKFFIGGNFNQVLVRFKCEFSQLSISEERRKLK